LAWQRNSVLILERWSAAFEAFIRARGDALTDNERKGAAVLGILKELGSTSVMLTRTIVDDQRNWDMFTPMFERIIFLAEEVILLDSKTNAGKSTFTIDMALGKIHPLPTST
jgi:hypothetical protein